MSRRTSAELKQTLWERFGSPDHPAEWDGSIYGGGKLSQRFWEYFKAIELLDLQSDSVVLDIGGGSPVTGAGFFSSILAKAARHVIVMDPEIAKAHNDNPAVTLVPYSASYDTLREVLLAHPKITHVSSISVMEHIPADVRTGIMRAINEYFHGQSLVMTFEYHATERYFEHQLTTRTASEMTGYLTRYYLDTFDASPISCVDAIQSFQAVTSRKLRFLFPRLKFVSIQTPKWYPIALRFVATSN